MSNPFKDQFLKKGLVTKKRVKKVSHEQRLTGSAKVNSKRQDNPEIHKSIEHDRREQAALDKELNCRKNEAIKVKEIKSQITEIINQNRVDAQGDISFNFVDSNKINKLYVDKKIARDLSSGKNAIVKQDKKYFIVPAKAALQVKARDAEALILFNSQSKKEMDPDDPYSEFPIPDDY